jgi:hypothetical protein
MTIPDDNFDITQLPAMPSEDPIAELLGTRIVEMTDEELDKYVKGVRTAIEAPQSFRALLKSHGSVELKAKKTAKAAAKDVLNQLDL